MNALEVQLVIGKWSATKYDQSITSEIIEEHQVSRDAGKFNKQLLPKEHVDPITKAEAKIRTAHRQLTLPWKDGSRLLAANLYTKYVETISPLKAQFLSEVDKLVNKYEHLIQERRIALNGMFRESEYPSIPQLIRKHYVNISMDPVTNSSLIGTLKISKEEIDSLVEQAVNNERRRIEEAQKYLWEEISALLTNLHKSTEEDAKFSASTLKNLKNLTSILGEYSTILDSQDLREIKEIIEAKIVDIYNPQELLKAFNGQQALVVRKEVHEVSATVLSELDNKLKSLGF